MSTTNLDRADVVVRPLRFTDHLPQMKAFLSLLGFSPRVSRGDSWVTMVGGSGEVALHDAALSADAQSGETTLMFEVPDAAVLRARLAAAGFEDAEIYDEAWGRVLTVRGDDDTQLSFDERPHDCYGYQVDEPQPQHGIVSMALLFGPPTEPLERLFSAAGLVRLDHDSRETWHVWEGRGGLVALCPADDNVPTESVRLAFRTRESLSVLAERLNTAGYTRVLLTDSSGGHLTVTDPDGQDVLIQRLG